MKHRKDDNQNVIVAALEKAGCEVADLSAVGAGFPDLLVLRAGAMYLVEIKDGAKPPSARRLTIHQKRFHARWPVAVVCDEIEALRAVGL